MSSSTNTSASAAATQSYKSTTVSINVQQEDSEIQLEPSSSFLPQNNQFTSLIETEKLLHGSSASNEKADVVTATTTTTTTGGTSTAGSTIILLTNNDATIESNDDDDDEEITAACDQEINRITIKNEEDLLVKDSKTATVIVSSSSPCCSSPEPSGNLELVGLRMMRGEEDVDDDVHVDTHPVVEGEQDDDGGVVEFEEFDLECTRNSSNHTNNKRDNLVTFGGYNVSSKTVKSSMKTIQKTSMQSSSSIEKVEQVSSSIQQQSSIDVVSNSTAAEVQQQLLQQNHNSITTMEQEQSAVKENGTNKKKITEKKSKTGGNKKSKSNAEISKENISVKSSFSKFDSLAKSHSKNNVDFKNKELQQDEQDGTEATTTNNKKAGAAEPKKMYCASCDKQVFQMELIRAEKLDWHKNCFRCVTCRKVLSVDTYQSHEQKLYCKPHFKELFQPKAVIEDNESVGKDHEVSAADKRKSKLQLIICESQPKELPPDVVRASDSASTGLEDIQIDVRSKFEMFENYKEKEAGGKSPEPLPVKRSASVLAKLKKYENSVGNGGLELNGVSDEDLNGVDGIELQSDEDLDIDDEGGNSVIKDEIKRKLKNPLQAMNEIAHFKQMEQVRSKWEEGTFTKDQISSNQKKEELQKFRSRLCQGKSNQLKELYEKGVETEGVSSKARTEIEELKVEKARAFREMFEKGEVPKRGDDEDEEGSDEGDSANNHRGNLDLEVFEAGVAKESKRLFEEMDKKIASEQLMEKKQPVQRGSSRFVDNKKTYKDYEEEDSNESLTYRDPTIVRHGEPVQSEEDPLQHSKTTSKMLSVFRQMEENLSKQGDTPIIRPLKQFTPPRDTIIKDSDGRSSEEDEEEDPEEEDEDEEEEEDEQEAEKRMSEDDFLKEVGSLARARSLRAKFERWEQQENERNKGVGLPDELSADSIESAKNLKAKFEAMRLMGDGGQANKENHNSVPIRVNRFVLNDSNAQDSTNNSTSSSTRSSIGSNSPQQLYNNFSSLPPNLSSANHHPQIIMSSNEQCALCEKRVYVMEKVEAGGKMYHKNCFRCSQCKCILRMDTFTSNKGTLFCTTHFKQLFKIKGNYDEGFGHETQYQVWAKKQAATAQQN